MEFILIKIDTNNCSPGIVGTFVKAFVRACAGSFFRNPQMHRHFNMLCVYCLHAKASVHCGLFQGAVARDKYSYMFSYNL